MATMTSRLDVVDETFQTPIRRHSDTPIRFLRGGRF
jgi:hypothetical protein